MELKQYYFIKAKDNDEIKACFILYGTEEGLKLIGNMLETNKMEFSRVMLPARLDDQIAHLRKYCAQFQDFSDLIPSAETSQEMEEIVVQLLETGIVMQDRFSEELKSQVVGIYNDYKDRGGALHQPVNKTSDETCVEMAPPKPQQPVTIKKPSTVEQQIKILTEGSERAWNVNKQLLTAVAELHAEITKLKSGQETMVNRLDDLASSNISATPVGRSFKCIFCEADDHGYKECEVKEVCIRYGLDNHKSEKCFWMSNSCSWCSTTGHASKLHLTKDQGFRLKVMNEYGPELFAHFWADQQQDTQEQVPVVVKASIQENSAEVGRKNQGIKGKGQGAGSGRSANNGQGRIPRSQESKPYARLQMDPWTRGYSRPRGHRKFKR